MLLRKKLFSNLTTRNREFKVFCIFRLVMECIAYNYLNFLDTILNTNLVLNLFLGRQKLI